MPADTYLRYRHAGEPLSWLCDTSLEHATKILDHWVATVYLLLGDFLGATTNEKSEG